MFLIFFNPQKLLCTIGCHPSNYIGDLGHSWGTSFKNRLGSAFKYGFNKASNYLKTLLTEVAQQVRARGGGAESTPQKDATGSPESSPPRSGKVQYGLSKFFGSASQKKEAGAVPLHLQVQPYKRQRLSRFQQDALRERNEAIRDRETERQRERES